MCSIASKVNVLITAARRRRRYAASFNNLIVSDTFTRADALTLGNTETGQAWEELNGSWGIIDGQAYLHTAAAEAKTAAVVEAGISDIRIEVDASYSVFGNDVRLCYRATDVDNCIIVLVTNWEEGNTIVLHVLKRIAGAFFTIVSNTFLVDPGFPWRLKVVAAGSRHTYYINDVLIASVLEPFNQTATKHGIGTLNNDPDRRFDNFVIYGR
jgi:hypothetical protein